MIKCKKFPELADWLRNYGWIPEWPKGTDCKSAGTAFEGSNPSPPILHNTGLQAVKCNLGCTKFGLCIKIYQRAGVAELADAQDLKSCGTYTPVPVRFRSAALIKSCKILYMQCLTTFFAKKGVNTNEKGISE